MKMKLLLSALTALIGTAVFAAEVPPVGSAAPDFSLPDAKGKTHSLSQYKGKYVVLEWFNPECPFVKKHYGSSNMQNLQKEFTDKGVVWLTIDSNAPGTQGSLTAEEAQKIATSWKTHETALLLDPEGNAGRAYGAKNTPNIRHTIMNAMVHAMIAAMAAAGESLPLARARLAVRGLCLSISRSSQRLASMATVRAKTIAAMIRPSCTRNVGQKWPV